MCESSGRVREEFRKRGHDAVSVDVEPSEIPGPHIQDDALNHLDDGWDLLIGFPPCTHTAVSGARWFPEKRADGRQQAAIDFFMALWNAPVSLCSLEQPISIMSTVFRKPDQIIQPWMFGHGETKATCLWLRGLPLLVPTNIVDGREARVHRMAPSPTRARDRARTFPGIAAAMAEQWANPTP